MFNALMLNLFFVVGLIHLIHLAMFVIGANIYDIRQFNRQRRNTKRSRKALRPLVSVIIPAHNESTGIVRTLDTVRKSSYKNIQIIVVNDASKDDTAQIVKNYIKAHPKAGIELLNKRKNVGKGMALNHAIKKLAKGDLVMTLDGDSILSRDAIKNVIPYFDDPQIIGVAANVRVMEQGTMLSILQKFEHMIGYRSKKFYTLTNSEFIVGGVASTYRREVMAEANYYDTDTITEDIGLSIKLIAKHGNRTSRIIYAADVVAATEGVQTYKALFKQRYRWKMGMLQNLFKYASLVGNNDEKYGLFLTLYRIPMAFIGELLLLTEPLILAYVIYLSIIHHTIFIILGAYLTITLYLYMTLWPDEHSSLRDKLRQSFIAPYMYFMFYVMNAVQIVAIIRCIGNYNKVVKRKGVDGRFTSPERAKNAKIPATI